jgi:hypothetical protein
MYSATVKILLGSFLATALVVSACKSSGTEVDDNDMAADAAVPPGYTAIMLQPDAAPGDGSTAGDGAGGGVCALVSCPAAGFACDPDDGK